MKSPVRLFSNETASGHETSESWRDRDLDARRVENGRQIGVAATAFPAATEAACEMFRAGGNAVDAALAAAWALAVCEPSNSGLGGQTIMLIRDKMGRFLIFDGHSRAPEAVSLQSVSESQQRTGHRATTVPSTPLVLETARQRLGRLTLSQVIAPAIRLASEGFFVTPLYQRQLGWCRYGLAKMPSARRFFLKQGRPYLVGQWFRQPELAATLQRIARCGVEDFYRGHIARQISDDMRRASALLTLEDLASIDPPVERQPILLTYRNCTVVTTPPPAGGLQVLLGLKLLQRLADKQCDTTIGCGSSQRPNLFEWYEMLGEVTCAVFRERERLPITLNKSIDGEAGKFLSDECADRLAEEIRARSYGANFTPASRLTDVGPRLREDGEEAGETTHLCTADAEGNVVSLTQSIQSLFGARVACEPCGFLYNNYLLTCPRQRHPYQLAGHCLPRSNSAPTFVCLNARGQQTKFPVIALGAAGSRRATSAILQTVAGVVERRLSLADAINAPRIHVKLSRRAWLERSAETEPLVTPLSGRFPRIQLRSRYSYTMGCVQAIQIDAQGALNGAADPRREGTVRVQNYE